MKSKEYATSRLLTILMGTLMVPLGTWVGYEFGARHTGVAVILLIAQTAMAMLEAHLWWATFEKGRDDRAASS